MKLTGTVFGTNRNQAASEAGKLAEAYFGHTRVDVKLEQAELEELDREFTGEIIALTFSTRFTATEQEPTQ